ncbi:MAG: hypothetical protein ACI4MC_05040 [Candidatus Coproplasma sp.]
MAVDTPVLERNTSELTGSRNIPFAVPTRSEYEAEEEHNARIKDNYARLINPNNRIEDVFHQDCAVPVQESVEVAAPTQSAQTMRTEPYLVTNARADSAIFRADNPINQRFVSDTAVVNEESEEEDDDLRPTAATRQYRTVDVAEEEPETMQSEGFSLSKKQKTMIIVLVAVVVSLIALIVINATVIANLNTDISALNSDIAGINAEIQSSISQIVEKINRAQSGLDTLRGATAGANIGESVADVLQGFIG